jgi:hypothetical protein
MKPALTRLLTFRISEETGRRIDAMAAQSGLAMADLCRLGVDYILDMNLPAAVADVRSSKADKTKPRKPNE